MKKNTYFETAAVASQYANEGEYWLGKLDGVIRKSNFPYDFKGSDGREPSICSIKTILSGSLFSNLIKLSDSFDPNLHMILIAGLVVLLKKYANKGDIIVGYPIYKQKIEGKFSNTILFLKSDIQGHMTFKHVLMQVRESILKAGKNQNYPIESIIEKLNIPQNHSGFPLFEIVLILENIHDKKYIAHTNPNMFFSFKRTNINIEMVIEYNAALYKKETVEKICCHFIRLLDEVFTNLNLTVENIELLTDEEKRKLLFEFNDTRILYKDEKTVQVMFEEQVEKIPDVIAVEFNEKKLTYRELNNYANQVAHRMMRNNIFRDSIVGLMTVPSFEMITGIIGILKAGGAYLSIDPGYPPVRILSMLKDSGTSHLITTEKSVQNLDFTFLQNLNDPNNEIVVTSPRSSITDLNVLPFPDRTLVDYKKYLRNIGNAPAKNTISIISSRGCPYHCLFCHKIWPKQHFHRSAENIFQEISNSYHAGIRRFVFLDDIFNFDLKNSSRLLEMIINHRLEIQLFFPNGLRSDRLTKEYIDLLANAGTVNIDVALESASPRIQKMIRKNLNLEKFQENIDYILKKYPQIILELEMMIGFPTETEEEALTTYELLKSLKWVHFPNLNILKIYPNTDISRIAIENGVSEELINRSSGMAYHEIPETLPFSKEFALQYQSIFFSEYFFSKERLLHVLPAQMKVLTEDELVKKYNSYLPLDIKSFNDLLEFSRISPEELGDEKFLQEDKMAAPGYEEKIKKYFPIKKENPNSFRLLLLDCSQLFSPEAEGMLYDVVEAPLGLMYILTYLNNRFGGNLSGKIAKSRIDFDSFDELKEIVDHFKPQLIGIRCLSFYKNLFHKLVSLLKLWYPDIPIITGGPYSTSDYTSILSDRNVDLAVLGEGEITISELIEKMLENNGKLPEEGILREIPGLAFLAVQNKTAKKTAPRTRNILFLDRFIAEGRGKETGNPPNINYPKDLAYVLFTSGSTGKPKGVTMTHRALSNLIRWQLENEHHSQGAVTLQFASFCFDVSFQEIFSTLCSGGRLILLSKEMKQDITSWFTLIKEKQIERLFLPFTVLQQFSIIAENSQEYLSSLREIITAGEQLQITPAISALMKCLQYCTLHNHYGPTESHVVTYFPLKGQVDKWPSFPPIGKPISNAKMRILDQGRKLVPMGVPGELCIGGAALSRGYLNRSELTLEKFIEDSYCPGELLYRTGDMTGWLHDGNIEFIGRLDNQVKIRGFRVELGEIESKLLNYDKIKEAAIIAKTDENGDKFLCAYFVPKNEISISRLKEYLSDNLPNYMIPSYFIQLTKIPQTHSGKIDRRSLPEPKPGKINEYVAPQNELENRLSMIWSEVLGIEKKNIGINSNFFDLGGHSIKASILLSKIHKELNTKIPMEVLFKTPTIKKLSQHIRFSPQKKYKQITLTEKKEYYPLSSGQKRLFTLYQMEGKEKNQSYNMPGLFSLEGKLDKKRFEDAFQKLIERHETLRTSFQWVNGEPVQKINDNPGFSVSFDKLDENAAKERIKEFIKPFDLGKAPLIRVQLIQAQEEKYYIFCDMHHIISDGISMNILEKEFFYLYGGEELISLPIQYKDYSIWQNRLLDEDNSEKLESYWLKKMENFTFTELPADKFNSTQCLVGEKETIVIDNTINKQIVEFCRKTEVTKFIFLISIFFLVLSQEIDQEDITIGIPIINRENDLENLIGLFLNVILVRLIMTKNNTFLDNLSRTKEIVLEALDNSSYPFELLAAKLEECGGTTSNELFTILFNYFPIERKEELVSDKFKINSLHSHEVLPKYNITLYVSDSEDAISLNLVYKSSIYSEFRIKRILKNFLNLIITVLENENIKISDIEISDYQDYDELEAGFEDYFENNDLV
jgi:amino acid adenylation domain-containing protein